MDVLDFTLYFMPSVHHSLVFHARKISLAVGAAHWTFLLERQEVPRSKKSQ